MWSIVVAGGAGRRFGEPKQFSSLGGRPVFSWAVEACRAVSEGVVLVVPSGSEPAGSFGADRVVPGGTTRADSVRRGLDAVPPEADVIVVHDAARPLAPSTLFNAILEELNQHGVAGAVPGLTPNDTIKMVDPSMNVTNTLDRASLVAVQTPQAFWAEALRDAHARAQDAHDIAATDDAMLVESSGGRVRVVAGHPDNIKITTPGDLATAERLLAAERRSNVCIGQGFDVHRFSEDPDRPLVLGGVVVEGARGLAGHSDADALCHALADAILGALGLGDLGRHFPDTDATWAGADSVVLLTEVCRLASLEGFGVVNADCTIVADTPRLAPHTEAMVQRLGNVVRAPVSVKATRAEGMGALGRAEGIACLAVVLMERR